MIGADFDALIAAARTGDQAALGQLYRHLNPALVRFLGAQAAGFGEDLAQDVWVSAARSLPSFSGDERGFRAWIFTIARRRLVAHWRQAGRRPVAVTDPAVLADLIAPSEPGVDAQVLADAAVRALVAALPPEQAEIVLLRVVAGFDAEEVAAIIGKRPGTIRVLQHRALRRLAERFDEESVTK